MAKAKRTKPKRTKPATPPGPKPPPLPGPEALKAAGIDPAERPAKGDAGWWAEARDALDRVEILHAVWRWIAVAGYVPVPEDWDPKEGWPTPSEVGAVFGSWDEMLASANVEEALSVELLDRVGELQAREKARTEEVAAKERWFAEQERKLTEIRRQAEAARSKREAAESGRQDAEAAHAALHRERDALAARVRELEAELEAARTEAEPDTEAEADAVLLRAREDEILWSEVESELAAHARTQQQRDDLHERLEALRAEREHDRRTIAELTRLLALAETTEATGDAEAVIESPPGTVLEAVERAAAGSRHLRFARHAFDSAADSPFRRPGLVLRTLRALDEVAGRFAAGEMGVSLGQAAAEHGITQWKPGVAETTRKRYADDYTVSWEGHRLELGPHIGLGSGSGAQFIARIYLHVSEGGEIPRGITVGHVGRHLPDTTT